MGRREHRSEVPEPPSSIGALLTEARERQDLTLVDVEQATKIRQRYLEGLELDDYTVLPDAVYVQGFLKTYANYLNLDGEELSERLKEKQRGPRRERQTKRATSSSSDGPLLSPVSLAGTQKRRVSGATVLTVVVSVFVLAAVIGSLYYVGRGSSSTGQDANPGSGKNEPKNAAAAQKNSKDNGSGEFPEKAPSDNKTQPAKDASTSKPDEKPASKSATPDGSPSKLRVAVRVEGSAAWFQVVSDGEVVYQGIGEPGYSETFKAKREISISTGNAGSVGVQVNGQDVGILGGYGEVLTRSFTKKAAS